MISKSRTDKVLRQVGIRIRSKVVSSGLAKAADLFLEILKKKLEQSPENTSFTAEEIINIIRENKELNFLLVNETFEGIINSKDKN